MSSDGCYLESKSGVDQSLVDYSTGSITQSLTSKPCGSKKNAFSEENYASKADIHDVYDLVKLSKLSLKAKNTQETPSDNE